MISLFGQTEVLTVLEYWKSKAKLSSQTPFVILKYNYEDVLRDIHYKRIVRNYRSDKYKINI